MLLLVEDDADNVVIVEAVLRQAGHEVLKTDNGADAIELTHTTLPDLVVLDLSLSGELTGLDVCRALRADQRTAAIPVLILTGWAFEEDLMAGLVAGADDYVTKPFETSNLCDRIDTLLTRARESAAPPSEVP